MDERGSDDLHLARESVTKSPSEQAKIVAPTHPATSLAPNTDALARAQSFNPPKVSVMLITYNHEKYIAQALESVLMQQTNFDFEINVIEDCSTDRTREVVMEYVLKYPHIVKPYFNKKNIGFKVTQRNFYQGFKTLKGDYFAILEGDDYWTSPDKLQRQVDFLDANPDFAICAHNTVKIYEDGSSPPHRFLYWGQRSDATIDDVINLQAFFHTTGVLYRNGYHGIPPRGYRSKWSCDIFVMISHATFGKVHHIDEDMAVYRAHPNGRFSGMGQIEGWIYNIDSLRRYNMWLRFRYFRAFSVSISRYCEYVLSAHGKDGVSALSALQFARIWVIWALYRSVVETMRLPRRLWRSLFSRPTQLAQLPTLPEHRQWDLVWGLNVTPRRKLQPVIGSQCVLELTAVKSRPEAMNRHALSQRITGLLPGARYQLTVWVKPVRGANLQVDLRDSVEPATAKPSHEGEARFDLMTSSVLAVKGLQSASIMREEDGWHKVQTDIATKHGEIFAYIGLLSSPSNVHSFDANEEALLFGGIEIARHP